MTIIPFQDQRAGGRISELSVGVARVSRRVSGDSRVGRPVPLQHGHQKTGRCPDYVGPTGPIFFGPRVHAPHLVVCYTRSTSYGFAPIWRRHNDNTFLRCLAPAFALTPFHFPSSLPAR